MQKAASKFALVSPLSARELETVALLHEAQSNARSMLYWGAVLAAHLPTVIDLTARLPSVRLSAEQRAALVRARLEATNSGVVSVDTAHALQSVCVALQDAGPQLDWRELGTSRYKRARARVRKRVRDAAWDTLSERFSL